MNLALSGQRAATVRGRKSAARLYNDIEYELALGEPSVYLEDAGERALALLEGRFPGVREAARDIEQPPKLSRQAGEALDGICIGAARRPARWSDHHSHRRAGRSRTQLFASARAHPVATLVMVTVSTIVIVHFWAYIALATITLALLNASRAPQK
jgi:hypothetical protein